MINYEIIPLLKSLSGSELKNFDKFLASPYFNSNKKLVQCFRILKTHYPDFSEEKLTKSSLYTSLYPGKLYKEITIKRLLWEMSCRFSEFIVQEYIAKHRSITYDFLLNELNNKNLKNSYVKYAGEIERKLNSVPSTDSSYFLQRYNFKANNFNFTYINKKILKKINLNSLIKDLDDAIISLNSYNLIETISAYLNLLTLATTFKLEIPGSTIYRLVNLLNPARISQEFKTGTKFDFLPVLYIKVFYAFTKQEDTSLYYEYKKMIIKYQGKLDREELAFHFFKLLNYCILKTKNSKYKKEFEQELFSIYKYMLEYKFYRDGVNEHLQHDLFRDILLLALNLKEFAWSDFFINKYSNEVNPEDIINMKNFGNMYLNYYKGNYREALDNINNINLVYFIYKHDINSLKLRIYFELEDYEGTFYMIKSYSEYLRTNDMISDDRKKRYMKFVKILEKIVLLQSGKTSIDPGYLKKSLETGDDVAYKSWLIEKIDEIMNF